MNSGTGPPSGWYQDPNGSPGRQRWWNGGEWTEHVNDAGTAAPATPFRPPATAPKSSGLPWWAWALIVIAILVVVVAIANDGSGGSSGSSASGTAASAGPALPPGAPTGAVAGELSKDCSIKCTSPDAADNLGASAVYCAWNGGDVHVHATLTNGMNAAVKLSIVPKYFLDKGGQHGTSFGSDIPVKLAPHETKHWVGNAGQPEAVAPGLPIVGCAPRLEDIDIGG